MPIEVQCDQCGKRLRAPDSAAGRRAKCPQCGQPVQIPAAEPEPVYEAEEIDEFDAGFGGAPAGADRTRARRPLARRPLSGSAALGRDAAEPDEDEYDDRPRKPCPECGEEIIATARKCRFCGEVLDASLGRRGGRGGFSRTKIERFRKEIHGLGIFWIVIGSLALLAGILLLAVDVPDAAAMAIIVLPLAVLWITIGVFTRMRHLWAVYVGLVLSYLSVVGNIIGMATGGGNICGIILMIAAVVQAHRVISMAGEMKQAGVPLRD